MRVLTADPPPAELEAVIERRQALGQDRYDEVWEGVYHMTPGPSGRHAHLEAQLIRVLGPHADLAGLTQSGGFNVGDGPHDYRVPDGGYHRSPPFDVWIPTAAIVVEILSPGDETYARFGFYRAHGVEEIIVVDPDAKAVHVWRVGEHGTFTRADASVLLDVSAADVTSAIAWP